MPKKKCRTKPTAEASELLDIAFGVANSAETRADLRWFEEHPGVLRRTRPPTAREIRKSRLPKGARVMVLSAVRFFVSPATG
jgi:hypothetical protein